jgi:threonine synthase
VRILELATHSRILKKDFSSFSDEETKAFEVYQRTNYIAEPHGIVGYLGLKGNENSSTAK